MSELSNIFKSFCNATNKKMLGFNKEYDIIFENGFDTESINQLQHLIQLLEDKNKKTVLSLSGESYSLNIVKINNEEYYLVVKVPEFFDDSYSDPFLKEQGAFFDSLDNDVVVMRDTQVIFRNKKMLKVLGLSEENALEPYKKLQPQHSLQKFNEFLRTKTSGNVTLEINDKNKKIRLVKASISYIIFNGIGYHVSMVKDIEQSKDIEKKYVAELDYLRHTIRVIDEGVIVLNSLDHITMFNQAASKITGIVAIDALDKKVNDLIQILDENKNIVEYMNKEKFQIKNAFLNREDGLLWNIAFSIDSIKNDIGDYLGKVLTIVDISDIKRREEEILYLSYHDVLTGLYNRTYLEETIKRLDTPREVPFSVIMGDVNGLKMTNDVFGHDEGDNLLRNVSKMLKRVSRSEDIIGRWGGDEFVILLPKTSEEEAYMITKRIIRAFEDIDDSYYVKNMVPSISLGYGVKKDANSSIYDVLKIAETNMYKRKMLTKDSIHSSVISSMRTALYEKSHETEEHSNRLYKTCMKVAKHYEFTSSQYSDLELLCMIHDVGKIGIPDNILNYPGPLDDKQWELMKTHSEVGYRIALATPSLKKIANYILSHHEHYDGTGYPKGLKGEDIPLINRILCVADSFDAMTNDRIYKKGISHEDAFIELERCSGTQFDPGIVKLFIEENKTE